MRALLSTAAAELSLPILACADQWMKSDAYQPGDTSFVIPWRMGDSSTFLHDLAAFVAGKLRPHTVGRVMAEMIQDFCVVIACMATISGRLVATPHTAAGEVEHGWTTLNTTRFHHDHGMSSIHMLRMQIERHVRSMNDHLKHLIPTQEHFDMASAVLFAPLLRATGPWAACMEHVPGPHINIAEQYDLMHMDNWRPTFIPQKHFPDASKRAQEILAAPVQWISSTTHHSRQRHPHGESSI